MMVYITFTAVIVLVTVLPATYAHIALRHPSAYGYNDKNLQNPLSGKAFSEWWFHGNAGDSPSEVMTITAGRSLTVELACSNTYSTYGDNPSTDACPNDSGSYHAGGVTGTAAGWTGNTEDLLMGCALAIAPTASAGSTNPADFTIMSIQENCVRQRDTAFAIPANLLTCPDGECTCAWFWQGQNSQAEMYMVGFRCKVEGGVATAFPKAAKPKKGAIQGATQPLYWANDKVNLDDEPDYESRPSYNSKFGWKNGAQTGAFGAAPGDGGEANKSSSSKSGSGGGGGGSSSKSKSQTATAVGGASASTKAAQTPAEDKDENDGDTEVTSVSSRKGRPATAGKTAAAVAPAGAANLAVISGGVSATTTQGAGSAAANRESGTAREEDTCGGKKRKRSKLHSQVLRD